MRELREALLWKLRIWSSIRLPPHLAPRRGVTCSATILPNSLAPIIVVGTTSLATYIVLEATLSFLGVGLPTTTVSWGGDISNAQSILRTDPMVLFYPSAALAITVLAFIMMGDAVKDALDPKSRT